MAGLRGWVGVLAVAGSLLSVGAAQGQATAPAVAFGSVNVGTPASSTVTFTFSASTTISSVSVVTQGATGKDFQPGTQLASACKTGTYAANATCTVVVQFNPLVPGSRLGAAILLDSNSSKLATGTVSGLGVGAFAQLPVSGAPSVRTPLPGGVKSAVYDAAGNLFINFTTNPVTEIKTDGTTVNFNPAYVGNSTYYTGLAIDGAGLLYIPDGNGSSIVQFDPVTMAQTTYTSAVNSPLAVAFDPAGNLYASDYYGIEKVSSSGAVTRLYSEQGNAIISLAFDPAGNLYYGTASGGGRTSTPNSVYKIAAGQSTPVPYIQISGTSVSLQSIAIDAASNLFFQLYPVGVYELPVGSLNSTLIQSTIVYPSFVAVSGTGLIATALDTSSITQYNRLAQSISAPAGTATATGQQSAAQSVTVENDGNAAVNFTSFTGSGAAAATSGYTCATGTPLASAATCTVGVQFAPTTTGSPQTGTLTLAGNTPSSVISIKGYVAGDPVSLAFSTPPAASVTAGGNAGVVKVAVVDNAGGATTSTAAVTLAVAGPSYTRNYTVNAVNGTATFDLTGAPLTAPGTYTYNATSTGLTSAPQVNETVSPGPAVGMVVTPTTTTSYVGFPVSVTVKAVDAYGNTATSDTDTITLTSTDAAAALPAPFALAAGTATKPVTFNTAGSQTVTATDTTNPAIPAATSVAITVKNVPVYLVTTGTDDATGIAANCPDQANNGGTSNTCSLRDAFAAVTALSNSGTGTFVPTINFASSLYGQTITMTATSSVNGNVALVGPGAGANAITLSGNNAATFLAQAASAPITNISGLTFSNFKGAQSTVLIGGGTFTLTNDTFSNNAYTGSNNGGALGINGAITVTGCTFTGNTSSGTGGAFATTQTSLAISNSLFSNNTAALSGGALSTYGTSPISIINTAFLNNKANGGNGGAVSLNVSAPLTITNGTFNNNTATVSGGALYANGLLTISGSSFSSNQTGSSGVSNGGAIYNSTASTGSITNTNFIGNKVVTTGSIAYGGALYAVRLNLTNVLFSGNSVSSAGNANGGGAYYTGANMSTFTGVTFTGNTTGGGAPAQSGGAFYGSSSQITLYNTTITGNSAKTSGGYFKSAGMLNLYNSVISGNTAPTSPDINLAPTANASSYYNTASPCSPNCAPLLSVLGSFGGGSVGAAGYTTPVQVMIPLPGSPLLAAGNIANLNGATTDARGIPNNRTLTEAGATHVDIGAAEANYSLLYVQQPGTAENGGKQTSTVQLYESGSAFAPGVATGTLVLTDAAGYGTTNSVAMTASGLETLTETYSTATTGDTLTASVASTAYTGGPAAAPITVASVVSSPFNVLSAAGATEASLQIAGFPSGSATGVAQTVRVSALDTTGAIFAGYVGTVTLTSSDTNAVLPAPYTFTAADAGIHTFTVTIRTGGAQSITASDGSFTASQTGIFTTGYVFIANGSGSVTSAFGNGTIQSNAIAGGGIGAAVDASGSVWSINTNGNGVSQFTGTGAFTASYTGNGTAAATAVAIDGLGRVFVTNGNGTVNALTNAGAALYSTPVAAANNISAPTAISVDSSGSLWIASSGDNSAVELIGVAAPVVTPTVNAVKNATLGTRP